MQSQVRNFQKIWTKSYARDRADFLKQLGITDESKLVELANLQYVKLPSDIRFELETRTDIN